MRRRIATISIALAGFGLVWCGFAAQSAIAGGSHHGKRVILSPRSGKGYPARPVKIRVHTGRKSRRFHAQLNGHSIAQYFSRPSHKGNRRLDASLSYGLRHGQNRIHVRVGHRAQTSRFRIWRGRPLVGAGIDQHVAAGDKFFVTGRVSEAGKGRARVAASGARSDSGFSWSTVSTPPGAPPSAPGDANKRQTYIGTSVPGRYKLKVKATGAGGKLGSATVTVDADPTPAVSVETMATSFDGSQQGIQVGTQFYPAKSGSWAQLVVLDRQTLLPVTAETLHGAQDESKSYTNCSNQDVSPCVSALTADLKQLTSDQIAIVSSQPDFQNGISPTGLESALAPIGVARTDFTTNPGRDPGSISAIGVPGTPAGSGDWHAVGVRAAGSGAMRGYLVRDNKDNYVFSSYDHIPFNTHAPDSTDRVNVIQVGDQDFKYDDSAQDGGFQVVVADAQNPSRIHDDFFFRTDVSQKAELENQLEAMRKTLQDANTSSRPQLVLIASLDDPALHYYTTRNDPPDAQINTDVQRLVDEVERLGGTRNGFYKTIDPQGFQGDNQSYSLVSLSNSGPGRGNESLARGPYFTDIPMNTTPMSGTLARTGPNYTFQVEGSPRVGPEATGRDPSLGAAELGRMAFQRPTPWPDQDASVFPNAQERTRKQAAITWISKQVLNTNDIRAQYWTSGLDANGQFDESTWKDIAFAIQDLDYPGQNAGSCPPTPSGVNFCPADLDWARNELAGPSKRSPLAGGEIGWLISTHKYLEKLAEPFQVSQLKNWASLQDIADSINTKINVAPNTALPRLNVSAAFTAFFNFGRNILVLNPEIGEAVLAVDTAYDLISELSEVYDAGAGDTVPATDDFHSTVATAGVDLADRLSASQEMLTRQLPNTIAADYGKLSQIGACTTTILPDQSKCPFPLSDWQYSQQDQKNAGQALVNGTKLWAYGQLLPAKYTLYKLPEWWRTSVGDNEDFYSICGSSPCVPFKGLPASAQVAKPLDRNMPTYSHSLGVVASGTTWGYGGDSWQIFALGHLDTSNSQRWAMQLPDKSVTDPLFSPISKGGLGADPESFYDTYFTPATLDAYPTSDDEPKWCPNGHWACAGQQP